MGIDIQALKLLVMATTKKEFGRTVTIGRQGLYTPKQVLDQFIDKPYREFDYTSGKEYCEQLLLDHFGSTHVDSIDASTYEGANIIHDMNKPIDEDLLSKYDTVFDGGCLEHIFNINQALLNVSNLVKVGGQIIHVLPANNQCGHGFWQFSPELFFSLYTENNGYTETEIFIGDTTNPNWTYKLDPPPKGGRHDIQHSTPLYVMVRTVKNKENISHTDIYQSDYLHNWEK